MANGIDTTLSTPLPVTSSTAVVTEMQDHEACSCHKLFTTTNRITILITLLLLGVDLPQSLDEADRHSLIQSIQ